METLILMVDMIVEKGGWEAFVKSVDKRLYSFLIFPSMHEGKGSEGSADRHRSLPF